MAGYNEILNGRYNKSLNATFGIKAGAPSSSLAGEIMPVHVMENKTELRYQEGWNRFGISTFLAASVGNFNQIFIQNIGPPLTSGNPTNGLLTVIEKIRFTANLAAPATVFLQLGSVATGQLGVQTLATPLDSRIGAFGNPPVATSATRYATQTAAALGLQGTTIDRWDLQGGVFFFEPLGPTPVNELMLLPGDFFTIFVNAVNNGLGLTAWWRERVIESTEIR